MSRLGILRRARSAPGRRNIEPDLFFHFHSPYLCHDSLFCSLSPITDTCPSSTRRHKFSPRLYGCLCSLFFPVHAARLNRTSASRSRAQQAGELASWFGPYPVFPYLAFSERHPLLPSLVFFVCSFRFSSGDLSPSLALF